LLHASEDAEAGVDPISKKEKKLKLAWCNLDCMEGHRYAGTIAAGEVVVSEIVGKSWEEMGLAH
jgi:hypothetical protein